MRFLRCIADGNNAGFSSVQIISKYKLGSSANIAVIKKALLERDLIVETDGMIELCDPVIGYWLKR